MRIAMCSFVLLAVCCSSNAADSAPTPPKLRCAAEAQAWVRFVAGNAAYGYGDSAVTADRLTEKLRARFDICAETP